MRLNHVGLLFLVSKSMAWNHVNGPEFLERTNKGRILAAYIIPNETNSQALEKEWTSVRNTEGVEVVSIDCSAEAKLCEGSRVSSFPALRLHHPGGGQTRYRGLRRAESIEAFLRRASRPALSHVTAHNTSTFQTIDDIVFIGRFRPQDTGLQRQFKAVAERYHDRYSFAIAGAQQGSPSATVDCFHNPDGMQRSTAEFPNLAAIEGFVKRCATPLIPELTRRNELSFYETRKSIVHYFVRNNKEREAYVTEMRPLARKYEEYLHFVTTDAGEYADAAGMMGLEQGTTGLSVQNPNNGDVFPYTRKERITAGVVEAFLGDIIQGKIQPWRLGEGHDEL